MVITGGSAPANYRCAGDLEWENNLDDLNQKTEWDVHIKTQPHPAPSCMARIFRVIPKSLHLWLSCNVEKNEKTSSLYEIQHLASIHLRAYFVPYPCPNYW